MSECVTRSRKAVRPAWIAAYGPIPDGLFVCHACDNGSCVNLDHLWLGTQSDNMRDWVAKGRSRKGKGAIGIPTMRRRGPAHPGAKLTDEAVREIRASTATQKELAERFGVSQATISSAQRCLTWRHVS